MRRDTFERPDLLRRLPIARPSEYKQEYCDMIIEFMSHGKSLTAFAASINEWRQRLYDWAEQHEEFADAIKKAKVKSQAWWENKLQESCDNKNINVTAPIFALKTRFGYRDQEPSAVADVPEDSFDTEYGELKSKYVSTK